MAPAAAKPTPVSSLTVLLGGTPTKYAAEVLCSKSRTPIPANVFATTCVKIELVDFGATRQYSKEFIDNWLHLLQAAAADDAEACIEWSRRLGYLTGEENEVSFFDSFH